MEGCLQHPHWALQISRISSHALWPYQCPCCLLFLYTTPTSFRAKEDHVHHVQAVLCRLLGNPFFVKAEKCERHTSSSLTKPPQDQQVSISDQCVRRLLPAAGLQQPGGSLQRWRQAEPHDDDDGRSPPSPDGTVVTLLLLGSCCGQVVSKRVCLGPNCSSADTQVKFIV